jgi:hypothetical protein
MKSVSAVGGQITEASAAANTVLLNQMSSGWHGLGLPIDTAGVKHAATVAGMPSLAGTIARTTDLVRDSVSKRWAGRSSSSPKAAVARKRSYGGGGSEGIVSSFTDVGARGDGSYNPGEPWQGG